LDGSANFYFKQLSASSCKKSKKLITDSFHFHPDRQEREKAILTQTFIDAGLNNTQITVIKDSSNTLKGTLGLIALSVGKIDLDEKAFPTVVIDYLFVDYRHRKQRYEHLEEKVSHMLLIYAIQTAIEISKLAGVRYLVLRPDGGKENKKLVAVYTAMKFMYMTAQNEWMFLKLV